MMQMQHNATEEFELDAQEYGLLKILLDLQPEVIETTVSTIDSVRRHLNSGAQCVISEGEKDVLEVLRRCETPEQTLQVLEMSERLLMIARRLIVGE